MLTNLQPYVIIISSCQEAKEDLLHVLTAAGCLVNGFSSTEEAVLFFSTSFIIPEVIVVERSSLPTLSECGRLKDIPSILIPEPVDMKDILNCLEKTILSSRHKLSR